MSLPDDKDEVCDDVTRNYLMMVKLMVMRILTEVGLFGYEDYGGSDSDKGE